MLFTELHLPPSGDTSAPAVKRRLGPRRKVRGNPFSTSKDVLEKLKAIHPLPEVCITWLKLTAYAHPVVDNLPTDKYTESDFSHTEG